MFKVTTNIDTLPKVLWFAVSPMGIHFMEIKGPNIYYTYTFDQVTSCTPTNKNLTIVVNKNSQKEEFFFYTNEGEQIVWLIKDYSQCVSHPSLENDVMSQAAKLDQDNASIESVTLDISS
ncbi:hypothetical protein LSH36_427g01037 [Paralvinella palmiformis]|uniref:IRS-type PTB domain-containing protein n=1 Tax=Paralvinella palmiformis TaxID=53620 RepID=A0AAD9JBW9_9ANNE|nr:hypothetical protein LSH36_427g01037 [Paralvinella palmiformis]